MVKLATAAPDPGRKRNSGSLVRLPVMQIVTSLDIKRPFWFGLARVRRFGTGETLGVAG